VRVYFRVYLGSPWPLPSVTKFTNMAIGDKKVQLGLAHRNVLRILLEPFHYTGEDVPSLLTVGSGMSDYQIVHRVRKHDVYNWAVVDASSKWHVSVIGRLCSVLDALTYQWFNASGPETSIHSIIKVDGVVGKAQQEFLTLLDSWDDDFSDKWEIVDLVTGEKRSEADPQITRYMRRNLIIFGNGMHRRYELRLAAGDMIVHRLHCAECSPTDDDKAAAWQKLDSMSECCKPFFCHNLRHGFSTTASRQGRLAKMVFQMRDKLKLFSTKRSEASHAHGQKLAGRSQKPLSLAVYARKAFLSQVAAAHRLAGGNKDWHKLSDKHLQKSERSAAQNVPNLPPVPAEDHGGVLVVGHAGEAVAEVGNVDWGQPEKKCGHLNPVLAACNRRARATALLGVKITPEVRAQILGEIKALYATDQGKADLAAEYDEYLRTYNKDEDCDIAADAPLASTFWGWGTRDLPVPLAAVQQHVRDHGLVPSSTVWNQKADSDFRVDEEEVKRWEPKAVNIPTSACGASVLNECR
jgi:hypothetical protein